MALFSIFEGDKTLSTNNSTSKCLPPKLLQYVQKKHLKSAQRRRTYYDEDKKNKYKQK